MSPYRILTLGWTEMRMAWRKPLPLVLLVLFGLILFGLAVGNVRIGVNSGTEIGGPKPWSNSETSIAFVDAIILGMLLPFFASVQCGMGLINDEDRKLDRVLLSTPLSPLEYVLGRFLGAIGPIVFILAAFVLMQMTFLELLPMDDSGQSHGPFRLVNYVRPMALFGIPLLLFSSGLALLLGTLTRQPVVVFAIPTVMVVSGALFLWSFSPDWLPDGVNRLLQWCDPAGVRWMIETFKREARGVEYLNSVPVVPNLPMILSRVVLVGLGMASVPLCGLVTRKRLRGWSPRVNLESLKVQDQPGQPLIYRAFQGMPESTRRWPGFFATTLAILGVELRALVRSPGVWLFGPLIILQVVAQSTLRVGPMDTFVLSTPGSIAGGSFNTLSLLLIFLTLYYTVESLVRESRHGFSVLLNSSPAPTSGIFTGKILANGVLACFIALGAYLGALIALLWQYSQSGIWFGMQPGVFGLIWGILLAPTLIIWSAFVALVRNRYGTYAICLALLVLTGFANFWGWTNWASLWNLWNGVRWSELDRLGFAWNEIVWNRLLMLSISAVLIALALRAWPRRTPDARGIADRFQPGRILKASLPLLGIAMPAIIIASGMLWTMRAGPEGGPITKKNKDYWRQNIATWKDAPSPALDKVVATVDLYPHKKSFHVKGEYVLSNRGDNPMDGLPLTVRTHLQVNSWKLDGKDITPVTPAKRLGRPSIEDRSGLMVVRPEKPLPPGGKCIVGFELVGNLPEGWSKTKTGAGQFVLPSGVVLTSFDGSFLPVIGFFAEAGVDETNKSDAREYPDDLYKKRVDPEFGPAWGTDVEFTVSAPEHWTINCVGTPGPPRVEGGRKTVVWKSDQPVRFFNLVGGPENLVETKGKETSIFHAREHSFHAERMSEMLDAARKYYSEWFHPYPWRHLKLTEFPGLAGYAQGFPGNITFSESIGFLAAKANIGETDAVDFIVAHEAAHQWWGNILTPGKGPGGNVLSEGMANYSSALLVEKVRGEKARQVLMQKMEREYVLNRNPDRERSLNKVDGSRDGDSPVIYNRGGWVFWMLMKHMGRERMLKGLREFINRFKDGPDFPLIEDLVETLRPHAPDTGAFDNFVNQWLLGRAMPEFSLDAVKTEKSSQGYLTRGRITNKGTGTVRVDVAVIIKEKNTTNPGEEDSSPRENGAIRSVLLGPGSSAEFELKSSFVPTEVVVDPDIHVLQMARKLARAPVTVK